MLFTNFLLGLLALVLQTSAFELPVLARQNHGLHPSVSNAGQLPLTFPAPEQSLSSLSREEFTTLSHVAFPGYGVRVKKTEGFCDPTVKAYTGYLDVDYGAKHIFFYFFESRSDPEKDDIMMWITGGPGCSCGIDMIMQLGPCRLDTEGTGKNGTVLNPYSWNDKANMFFIDQPVNVGFSYAEFGEVVETTEDAAKNVAAFAYIFFETFAEFKGRPFHMAGSSYGGRYVPVFASEIIDQNKLAAVGGFTPINLKSAIIGAPFTDAPSATLTKYDMACTSTSAYPVLDISTCVRMKTSSPLCAKMMSDHCSLAFDELGCTAADLFCGSEIEDVFMASGYNPYDITTLCEGNISETLCYPVIAEIVKWLGSPAIRSLIGVDPAVGNYTGCDSTVGAGFARNFDRYKPTPFYVSALLERGIDVLIYVGKNDWICNWVGNTQWIEALEWTGQAEYNAHGFEEWVVDGERAGIKKGARGLEFAVVEGAGHFVGYDKSKQALAMINGWIASRKI